MSVRQLIVNADDFGLSAGVNRGIARAHDDGIVTSTSLMVHAGAARAATALASERPGLSVGLHVDLAEWRRNGAGWEAVYERVPLGDAAAVAAELRRQLERFVALIGRAPTHIDSHQHVHRDEPVRSVVLAEARRLGVPVRELSTGIGYVGGFYGQSGGGEPWPRGISVEGLCGLLRDIPAGTTELGCHPGLDDDCGSPYCHERSIEAATLCDPRVRETLVSERIELRSFAGALH